MSDALQRWRRRYWALYEWRKLWRPALRDGRVQVWLLWGILRHVIRARRPAPSNAVPSSPAARDARRLLFISYFSPPYKSVFGTQRLSKFIKYLGRAGWRITLITTVPSESQQDGAAEPFAPDVEVVRLPRTSYVPHLRGVLVPDHFIGWIGPAVQAGREIVQRRRPSAIYATVPPYSNALAAMLLSSETGVPLVTDFRDPWTRIDVAWVLRNRLLRWSSGLLERLVLRSSDAIVMADEIRYRDEFFVRARGAWNERVVSILNGYDDEDFEGIAVTRTKADVFAVSYVGTFYGTTTFLNVKHAFERLEQARPGGLDDVEFHYAGSDSKLFDEHGFRPKYLRDHGYISHRAAIELRAGSSLQLFCQPPTFKQHVISGKIYEMMRLPVPILAITDPAGTVARFIARTGTGVVADNRDPEGAVRALHASYVAWKSGQSIATRNVDEIAAFSRARKADELARVFDRLVGDARRDADRCAPQAPGARRERAS